MSFRDFGTKSNCRKAILCYFLRKSENCRQFSVERHIGRSLRMLDRVSFLTAFYRAVRYRVTVHPGCLSGGKRHCLPGYPGEFQLFAPCPVFCWWKHLFFSLHFLVVDDTITVISVTNCSKVKGDPSCSEKKNVWSVCCCVLRCC